MPTAEFSQTSAAGIPRAEIRTPPVDLDAAVRTTVNDPTTYSPLNAPGGFAHGFSPPEPEKPDEATFRARLVDALADQRAADIKLTDAEAAHQRALRHVERCSGSLQHYSSIDADLATATVDALRGDVGTFDVPDSMRLQLTERDVAAAGLYAAQRACTTLEQDLATARAAATEAKRRADALIANILSYQADQLAARHAALMTEAAQLVELAHSFNQSFVGSNVRMSPAVRALLGHDVSTLARRRDRAPWLAAAEALRADPSAEVSVDAQ